MENFLSFNFLLVLLIIYILFELNGLKKGIKNLSEKVEEVNFESKPVKRSSENTKEAWWEMEMPEVTVPVKLLGDYGVAPEGRDTKADLKIIKERLDGLNIEYKEISEAFVGPTVTQYILTPAKSTTIKMIRDLKDDFALDLRAQPIRIEAPIPGTGQIGLEVPNEIKAIIGLRGELSNKKFKKEKGSLLVAMGRDIRYESWYRDLRRIAHLLIGGSTCSGKSAFLHSLIIGLMTQYPPAELRFILADLKQVEFTGYNGLPYLLTPVILDYNKARDAVNWCYDEMDCRFETLSQAGFCTVTEYNEKSGKKMPYIVFIIDEMADLSVADENKRLADKLIKILMMSRAVGIHFIIASSRPCDETYSGDLRVYFPARLAFSTATREDSQIILDSAGAERLLGRGDALFIDPEMTKPQRLQIPLVSDEDIEKVVKSIRTQADDYEPVDFIARSFLFKNFDEREEEEK